MANHDVLKEVLLQMKNLKLSSPLRSDPAKDDNKENILAGQDIQKGKIEDKNSDEPIIEQTDKTTKNQSNCQILNGIDVNVNGKVEEFGQLITTALVLGNTDSESLVLDKNALNVTVTSEVNNICLDKADLGENLSNCEQKTSTQSLYDDCIEILERDPEENDANFVEKVSDDLNSTYQVDEQFGGVKEHSVEESPQNITEIVCNPPVTTDLNSTEEIRSDKTVIEDEIEAIETTYCESLHENSSYALEEGCDQTFIEHSKIREAVDQQFNSTYTNLSSGINELSPVEANISRNSTELEEVLLNITKQNCSVEDVEKSTAELVSDSSDRSLSTSLNNTQLHRETVNDSIGDIKEQIPETFTSSTNQVVDKSSSGSFVASPSKSENTEEEVSHSKNHSLKIEEPQLEHIEVSSESSQTVNLTEVIESEPDDKQDTSQESSPDSIKHSQSATIELSNKPIDNNSEESNTCENSEDIKSSCPEFEDVQIESSVETINQTEVEARIEEIQNIPNKKMEEISEKFQQEFSDTKLELNAVQQAKAILELELSKKDEIILKTQAEAMKKEQQYLQENKALKEQLKEKANSLIEKDTKENSKESIKDLEEALKEAKAKEVEFIKVLEEYEKTIATRFADYKKLKEENATVTRHLNNLELSFSDLHQKYEKAKSVICGYKRNEEKLRQAFSVCEDTFTKQDARYESLKAHAQSQIDKCNIEINQQKEKYEMEISKLKAIAKRLEIKNAALETSIEQKTKECLALAALCDEVTGKKF